MNCKKILVAHSSRILSKIITLALKEQSCELQFIFDGDEIIPTLLETQPDICLLELDLPNKDAIQIMRELKKQKMKLKTQFVLFLHDPTGGQDFAAHFVTPFDPADLRKTLSQILALRKGGQSH